MKLYVIYSNQKPVVDVDSVVEYLFSPNQNYSELWAQREIWKRGGPEDEMIGFFHFRRYLDFSVEPMRAPENIRPYKFLEWPDYSQYSAKRAHELETKFDLLAPLPEWTGVSVRKRYQQYPAHRISDLDEVMRIICDAYPDYIDSAKQYFQGQCEYYGNMYVMRRKLLCRYFEWLFSILEKFDKSVQDQLPRTPGYLAERLFGVWLSKQQSDGKLRLGYLPRVHFYGYDDATHHFKRDRLVSFFLPPGSRRRFYMKKMKRLISK